MQPTYARISWRIPAAGLGTGKPPRPQTASEIVRPWAPLSYSRALTLAIAEARLRPPVSKLKRAAQLERIPVLVRCHCDGRNRNKPWQFVSKAARCNARAAFELCGAPVQGFSSKTSLHLCQPFSGAAEPSFVARMEVGLSDFLFGPFPALPRRSRPQTARRSPR